MRIAIEGNIGTGKSTCMKLVKDALDDVVSVYEPLDIWTNLPNPMNPARPINMLDEYYHSKEKHSFPFQILVQNSYVQRCLEMESLPHRLCLTERTLLSSYEVFSRVSVANGDMNEAEFAVLTQHTKMMCNLYQKLCQYDLIVYLRATPEQCLTRINKRNRTEEKDSIPLQYLQQLHNAYEEWYNSTQFGPLSAKRVVVVENGATTLEETRENLTKVLKNEQLLMRGPEVSPMKHAPNVGSSLKPVTPVKAF